MTRKLTSNFNCFEQQAYRYLLTCPLVLCVTQFLRLLCAVTEFRKWQVIKLTLLVVALQGTCLKGVPGLDAQDFKASFNASMLGAPSVSMETGQEVLIEVLHYEYIRIKP